MSFERRASSDPAASCLEGKLQGAGVVRNSGPTPLPRVSAFRPYTNQRAKASQVHTPAPDVSLCWPQADVRGVLPTPHLCSPNPQQERQRLSNQPLFFGEQFVLLVLFVFAQKGPDISLRFRPWKWHIL
jgi:hypothetical protein